MKKILIVEDELPIAELEKDYLELSDFEVTIETDGIEGEAKAMSGEYDLLILDVMLPGQDGFEICRKYREKYLAPVIVVSAKKEDIDKIHGLGLGADDYMTKPFDVKEVIARVQIQLRHLQHGAGEESTHLKCRGMDLDKETHRVMIDGQELGHLTRQEFAILELLLEHPGQVFSKEAVFTYAWQEEYMGETKTLDVHISNIRKKIKKITEQEYIQTVWGIGYCMVAHL
ncbi:MAG TPA: DNA-binding response regulator [Lachnospiraceae bacterium]|nr:DNA-binding response regulator [Lachnospiraceae bacterium]